jgi:ElaB/YqjD/DUF883 family membrane-anchored ribosome-binding protein
MTTRQANDRLVGDLKAVARDAEHLVKATAGQAGERVNAMRNRMTTVMDSAKATYGKLQDKTLSAGKATDRYVRGRPYQTIGIALGLGLLLGVLIRRR